MSVSLPSVSQATAASEWVSTPSLHRRRSPNVVCCVALPIILGVGLIITSLVGKKHEWENEMAVFFTGISCLIVAIANKYRSN